MKKRHILIKKACFLKKRPLFCHFFNQNAQKMTRFLPVLARGSQCNTSHNAIKSREILKFQFRKMAAKRLRKNKLAKSAAGSLWRLC